MKITLVFLLFASLSLAAQPKCDLKEAFPYFKPEVGRATKTRDLTVAKKMQLKAKLTYLIEYSRFMNKKAPFMLQVWLIFKSYFQSNVNFEPLGIC